MQVLPKSLHVLAATLTTLRAKRQLRRANTAPPAQSNAFRYLTAQFAATAFGREHGIEPGMSYKQFRARVPLRGYDRFAPYIDRMKRGEADVLWPGSCTLFAVSSGTTGQPKILPVTNEFLTHVHGATHASMLYYTSRIGSSRVFRGRHLVLGGAKPLAPLPGLRASGARSGDLGNLLAHFLPEWVERHFYEPGREAAGIDDWAAKIAAIIARTRPLDISLLAGLPPWLLTFAETLRERETRGHIRPVDLQAIWPHLECVVHSGVPLAPYRDQLQQLLGDGIRFHEVYAATEGFIAAQDAEPEAGLRLIADQGLLFEFLPARDFDPALPSTLMEKAMPFALTNEGEDYAIVLTTPAGLCRYVLGDVVRIVSKDPARLLYLGRTQLQLSTFEEFVSEKDLTDSLVTVCQRHEWTITNFHVAPLVTNSLTGARRGRHEWWIELKPGTVETPTGPILAGQLDAELLARNERYKARRQNGTLEAPFVRLVMPGFFLHWLRHHHKIGGLHKMPRCSNERTIADELSAMACFHQD